MKEDMQVPVSLILDTTMACLGRGIVPERYLDSLESLSGYSENECFALFTIYNLRYWYTRSETGEEYWELMRLREEWFQNILSLSDVLIEVARSEGFWIL